MKDNKKDNVIEETVELDESVGMIIENADDWIDEQYSLEVNPWLKLGTVIVSQETLSVVPWSKVCQILLDHACSRDLHTFSGHFQVGPEKSAIIGSIHWLDNSASAICVQTHIVSQMTYVKLVRDLQ